MTLISKNVLKTVSTLSAAALIVCLSAAPLWAQDGERPQRGDRQGQAEKGERGERGPKGDKGDKGDRGKRGQNMTKALFKGVDLSEDQHAAIRELMPALKEKTQAFREENKDELQAFRKEMREAMQAKDKEAAEAIRAKMKKLMEQGPNPAKYVVANADAIGLTAEQIEQIKANAKTLEKRGGQRRGGQRGPHGSADGERGPRGNQDGGERPRRQRGQDGGQA